MVEPRIRWAPKPTDTKTADAAIAFCRAVKLELDEWQEQVLHASLTRSNGRLPLEVGLCIPRQNGKGELALARLIVGVFVMRQSLQIYSAHEFATALEHFARLEGLLEERPDLYREIAIAEDYGGRPKISHSHGSEGITFTDDRRILFRTRTKSGGRGFSGVGTLMIDEAMVYAETQQAAIMPVVSTIPDAQIWHSGSAVDQLTHEHGVIFARLRERGIKGDDPDLAYFEWSVEGDNPELVSDEDSKDRAGWAQANPALGVRIAPEYVETERRSMARRTFSVERLGVGDWPRTDHKQDSPISLEDWRALLDKTSALTDPVCLAFDVSPDRRTALAAAGRNMEGKWHVEVIQSKRGTKWLMDELPGIVERQRPAEIVCDGFGPAGSLIQPLEDLGVEVRALSATEHGQACGRLVDEVERQGLRHLGSDETLQAIQGAATRPLGDAWAWSRKSSSVNIAPLVALTLALSAAIDDQASSVYDTRGVLAL